MKPDAFDELAQRALEIFPRSRNSAEARFAVHGGEINIGLVTRNHSQTRNPSHSTRIAASYANLDDFEFSCGSNTPLQKVVTFFGAQDVLVGDAEFDRVFVVRSNDPARVVLLFSDEELRGLFIRADEDHWLTVHTEAADNPGVSPLFGCRHEVVWTCAGIEYDVDRLAARARLLAHILRRLCEIGVAKADA